MFETQTWPTRLAEHMSSRSARLLRKSPGTGLMGAKLCKLAWACPLIVNPDWLILGDPGATSRDDAIFSGESLLQKLKSPWELILTEPVPEEVEFCPADWAEKYFSAQSAMRSSRVTLAPPYTK